MGTLTLSPISCRGRVARNEPLARYSTLRIGGPADLLIEPADRDDLAHVVRALLERGTPHVVLGGGSNLLVSDAGFRGAVVRTAGLQAIRFEGTQVVAEAGVNLARLARYCAKAGLRGIEGLCGIPGTVGGAVAMNAGACGIDTGTHLIAADLLDAEGREVSLCPDRLGLRYRHSNLPEHHLCLLSGRFALAPDDPQAISADVARHEEYRRRTQPHSERNAGCMFKNPPGDSAGRLLDAAGAKTLEVGGARISDLHANFIINRGNATAWDVVKLMERAMGRVFDVFGVRLEPEVQRVGEWND